MYSEKEKIQILVKVAKMYYEENKSQNDIANNLGVSRPLISKYLSDAVELGIVEIKIHDLLTDDERLDIQLVELYPDVQFTIVPNHQSEDVTQHWMIEKCTELFLTDITKAKYNIGLGWGTIIGAMANRFTELQENREIEGNIVPLISNAPTSNRDYHTNELVRMMCDSTGLRPSYLYAPAICGSLQERNFYLQSTSCKEVYDCWDKLDYVFVGIRSHPSVPDLATVARFGKKLTQQKAVGLVLGYYFDIEGNIINSEEDFVLQVSLEKLKSAKHVIAIANVGVRKEAIQGALSLKTITHMIITKDMAKKLVIKN